MTYPFTWAPGYPLSVTLSLDDFGTNVDATFCGVPLARISYAGVFVGDAPGQRGFDDVRRRIEDDVRDLVAAALRLAQ